MRRALLGLTIATAALTPAAARAAEGDPLPLSEVRSGMQCTGLSVFRGTAVEPFDVEVVDVVGQAANGARQPRILVRVSGERVDATGVGPGFSGSPILCPAGDGTRGNIGAISETVGDFGGKTVLATPIEQILDTPVDPVRAPRSVAAQVRDAGVLGAARPLAGPITVGGLRTRALARGLTEAGLLAAPPVPADATPPQPLVPGSAVGVGLSSGDLTVGAIGTVAFTRGSDVWAFGHALDGAGARSLLLQDAYVATIINNPVQLPDSGSTYKLAGAVNTLGTITSDGFDAVAGRLGAQPDTTFVRVVARDTDTGRSEDSSVRVADETDVGFPTGYGALSYIAPLAVADTATAALRSTPAQVAGRMCLALRLRERRKPLRFCNRYVADGTAAGEYGLNAVASSASLDAAGALALLDTYKGTPVHPTHVTARLRQTRAQRQAYLRKVVLPRRVRRGQTVRGVFVARVVRGPVRRFPFRWTVPEDLERGRQRVRFRGTDPDYGGGFVDTITIEIGGGGGEPYDSEGPRTLRAIRKQFEHTHRYDGIRSRGERVFRDRTYRIGGVAYAKLSVLR